MNRLLEIMDPVYPEDHRLRKTHDGYKAKLNRDGSVSTEVTMTVTDPRINSGRPTNIPSLWGNMLLDEQMAIEQVIRSGKKYQPYLSIEDAVRAAESRSNELGGNRLFQILRAWEK